MFVCQPRDLRKAEGGYGGEDEADLFDVRILERHPFTPQTFIPMGLGREEDGGTCYLVIVAPTLQGEPRSTGEPKGAGGPDLEGVRAFVVRGDQGVTYGPGTWHAPMIVLGEKAVEFVVVQYANGVGDEDCQEYEIEDGVLGVEVGGSDKAGLRARL
jgi:ureidoglycolate lyase